MSYAQGSIISASDFNGIVSSNVANVNYAWSTGSNQWGYGQTAVSTVPGGGLVAATNWASLQTALNAMIGHQGVGTALTAGTNFTAGSLITYYANVIVANTSATTNHLTAASQGTTTTGSTYTDWAISYSGTNGTTDPGQSATGTRTVTFASADQARYFFNAGGQINVVVISVASTGSRGSDLATLIGTNLKGIQIKALTTSYQGSGGTVNTNNTGLGYYNQTTSAQVVAQVTSTNGSYYVYKTDTASLSVNTNGVKGSNSDNGTTMTIKWSTSTGAMTGPQYDQSYTCTVSYRIDVVYPETTYLSNSWGSVTIS